MTVDVQGREGRGKVIRAYKYLKRDYHEYLLNAGLDTCRVGRLA